MLLHCIIAVTDHCAENTLIAPFPSGPGFSGCKYNNAGGSFRTREFRNAHGRITFRLKLLMCFSSFITIYVCAPLSRRHLLQSGLLCVFGSSSIIADKRNNMLNVNSYPLFLFLSGIYPQYNWSSLSRAGTAGRLYS